LPSKLEARISNPSTANHHYSNNNNKIMIIKKRKKECLLPSMQDSLCSISSTGIKAEEKVVCCSQFKRRRADWGRGKRGESLYCSFPRKEQERQASRQQLRTGW
jgi:hypothetical protein